ncbi:MAG: DUF4240 domain-containing protein [Chloroflexota bacterium]
MNEANFWVIIENAWPQGEKLNQFQADVLRGEWSADSYELQKQMLANLTSAFEQLDKDELLAFDRMLAQKLYDIDRADVHEYTDGSDDGFLYARGFIVSVGRDYYELVNKDPSRAIMDAEFEEFCYHSSRIYEQRFGAIPPFDVSRETGSNPTGWS